MSKGNIKQLREVYFTFLKLGCVGFGGGYSMIPLIEREIVDKKKWVEKEKIVDIFAVAESLPGATALNTSAFVGYSIARIPGAISALLGNVTPSVIIVLTLSILFQKYSSIPEVKAAFRGIYPVIVGLILYAAYKIGKSAVKDVTGIIIVVLTFGLSLFLHVEPIPLIIAGAIVGVTIMTIRSKHANKKKDEHSISKGDEDNVI